MPGPLQQLDVRQWILSKFNKTGRKVEYSLICGVQGKVIHDPKSYLHRKI